MSIDKLIQQIAPLYNLYRNNKKKLPPFKSMQIMWDIGDLLKSYIEKNGIAPHKLFWSIYGNAEGSVNVSRKSYITREFQGRSFRIRKSFKDKKQIKDELEHLKNFTAFREAMPFFSNPKYMMGGAEKQKLLKLLNSEISTPLLMEEIKKLQKEKIGIKNPRTQRLGELEGTKKAFISFYNYIYELIKYKDYNSCIDEISNYLSIEDIKLIANNLTALTQEGLKFHEIRVIGNDNTVVIEFISKLNTMTEQKNPKHRRRFRRLIAPERLVDLSEMLYSLSSEMLFNRKALKFR